MDLENTKASIIKTINSPLGFFALSLLTVEGFLGIVLIYSGLDEQSKFWGMLIGAALFVLVVIIVSLLVTFKPKNLTFGEQSHLMEEGKYLLYGQQDEVLTRSELEDEPKTQETVRKDNRARRGKK